jgi:hypothetical protein
MTDERVMWTDAKVLLLEDLRRVTDHVGGFDAIVFSGDISQRGEPGEFTRFEETVLVDIWNVAAGPETVLLAVPGNHDLRRPSAKDPIARGLVTDSEARVGLFEGEAQTLEFIKARFAGFSAWWESCSHRPQENYQAGLLPGDFAYFLERRGIRIGFIGLNSAWLQLREGMTEGSLHVDIRQVLPACDGNLTSWVARNHLNFLLTHHPSSWLLPESQEIFEESIAPPGRFTGHLFGHLHEARSESKRVGGGLVRWVCQAPSLFGLEKVEIIQQGKPAQVIDRRHGFIGAQAETTASAVRITLWPRRGVKAQDASWRIASDWNFHLEDDLARVSPEVLPIASPISRPLPSLPAPAIPPPFESDWLTVLERSELWRLITRSSDSDSIQLIIQELVTHCQSAFLKASGNDPWTDQAWVYRTLDRVGEFVRNLSQTLTREKLAVLVSAPFLRATILAYGVDLFRSAGPFDFEEKGAGSGELRRRLEREHGAYESLVRRTRLIRPEDQRTVGLWLAHQAVRRWPALWRGQPGLFPESLRPSLVRLEEALFPGFEMQRLLLFARCTGGEPSVIGRRDGAMAPLNIRAELFVPAELACLLCVAGHAAFDLAMTDEVAVEHIGVEVDFELQGLKGAIREAHWAKDGRRHVLHYRSPSQIVDFVLRRLVANVDSVAEEIRLSHVGVRPTILSGLPERFTADGVLPAVTGPLSQAAYQLPHVVFRLDHNRVRDLLMGTRLYGDPSFAVRELYQNALDACRYRRARQESAEKLGRYNGEPYAGRIVFRQGRFEGRDFIECEDNGIGMTEQVLATVFSVAGRRFHDSPEFGEERAEWDRLQLKARFVPNSQFGIGVLSYFMLADSLEVRTRQFLRDGTQSPPLVARISSAAGLFRLERGEPDAPVGTTIRLYLDSSAKEARCRDILEDVLWVAEFETVVEDESEPALRWAPNKVGPVGSDREEYTLEAVPGEVWWSTEPTPVLADGIATGVVPGRLGRRSMPARRPQLERQDISRLFLANLRGDRYPRLSVDRQRIVSWDTKWLDLIANQTWGSLVEWQALTLDVLLNLERFQPSIARRLFAKLVDLNRALLTRKKGAGTPVVTFPVAELGCFSADGDILGGDRQYYDEMSLLRWRLQVLKEAGLIAKGSRKGRLPSTGPRIRPEPGDFSILEAVRDHSLADGDGFVLHPLTTIVLCSDIEMTRDEIQMRINAYAERRLSAAVSVPTLSAQQVQKLAPIERGVLKQMIEVSDAWEGLRCSPTSIYRTAVVLGMSGSEIHEHLRVLRPLGIEVPPMDDGMAHFIDDPTVRRLLSRDGDGEHPWRSGPQSLLSVVRTAEAVGLGVEDTIAKLSTLGHLGVTGPSLEDLRVGWKEAAAYLVQNGFGTCPNVRELPAACILMTLHARGEDEEIDFRRVDEIVRCFNLIGISVKGNVREIAEKAAQWSHWDDLNDAVETSGVVRPLNWPGSAAEPWQVVARVLEASMELRVSLRECAANLSSLGLIDESIERRIAGFTGIRLGWEDVSLIDTMPWEIYEGEDPVRVNIERVWSNLARVAFWERDEAELRSRISRLLPLFIGAT